MVTGLVIASGISYAESPDMASIVKSVERKTTTPTNIIRLTTNRNELIQLDQDASSVIVNNPAHASVMLDTPRLLIVVPHKPGATSFTVLDKNGKTILQKDLIVSNVEKKYVRVRRMCGNDPTCRPDSYYYCPDGCYEVTTMENGGGQSGAPLRPSGVSNAATDDMSDNEASNSDNINKSNNNNNNNANNGETQPSPEQNQNEEEPLPEE